MEGESLPFLFILPYVEQRRVTRVGGLDMRFLFLLFILFPAIEIGIFLFSGKLIGILPTVLLMILTGIIGAAAAKKQGTEVYYKVQRDLQYGKMPGKRLLTACAFSLAVYC